MADEHNDSAVMSVLLLVIGVVLIAKGLDLLTVNVWSIARDDAMREGAMRSRAFRRLPAC